MTQEETESRLAPTAALEEQEMSLVRCHICEQEFTVSVQRHPQAYTNPKDILDGAVVCGECHTENLFRLRGGVIEYRHDPDMFGSMPEASSDVSHLMYTEAVECFIHATLRASAAMCRATLEQVLDDVGYHEGTLEHKIDHAKLDGLIDDVQVAIAHGSRLMGNRALHRAANIQRGPVLAALGAVVSLTEDILEAHGRLA